MNLLEPVNMNVVQDVKNDESIHVVAIGASAGGLEALIAFVAGLDAELHCSYIVAHHTSPNYRSQMVDILGRETDLPVCEVVAGQHPQPNCVHIVPPGYHAIFKDGVFEL